MNIDLTTKDFNTSDSNINVPRNTTTTSFIHKNNDNDKTDLPFEDQVAKINR